MPRCSDHEQINLELLGKLDNVAHGMTGDDMCTEFDMLLLGHFTCALQAPPRKDRTAAYAASRQALEIVDGCFFDMSFRRSRSKSSPSSERPLISFCASIA